MTGLVPAAASISNLFSILAFVVLAAAVASAFLPGLPTGLISLGGTLLYWWSTNYSEPGTTVLVVLVVVSLLAVAADWFGGLVAAKVGGASTITTVIAGAVGLVLLFVTGPIGMVLGSAAVVFVLEFRKRRDAGGSAAAAGAYVVGLFASALVQALIAFSVLIAVLWVALV
jgi:uncharacterized protein YqgC (DUF456 family)